MKKILLSILLVAILLLPIACTPAASASVLKSDKPRATAAVDQADLDTLVNGNSDFAFRFYQALKGTEGNLFYSPYSISVALAMTYAGARSDTATEMADTLSYLLPQAQLHPALNNLDTILQSRGEGAQGKDGGEFRLNIVNAIWGQKDYEFLDEYLDTLAVNYGAGLRILDFIHEPEPSRITINDWVSEQTEQRIKDLIPQGAISDLTRLVLTNAIYFNAAWLYPFEEAATHDAFFNLLNGSTTTVSMMQQTKSLKYTEVKEYQAIELPYDGNELSMVILLPQLGYFTRFEDNLHLEMIQDIITNLEYHQVNLSLPKFEFDSSFSLKQNLSEMGMPVAFTENADFSGMNEKSELQITDVFHKAFVSVDEAGTEAAAATAVIVGQTSMPATPIEVTVDRPFIFFIRDIETNAILFVGRVVNPAA